MAGTATIVIGDNRLLQRLGEAVADRRPVVLATVVETQRSVPRHAGTKLLVFADTTSGTVGGGAMEAAVIEAARSALISGKTNLLEYDLLNPAEGDPGICGGSVKIYLEPFMPTHTVYVVGCGHVGKAVVDLAHWLGYRTIAVDDRAEFVSSEALPNAEIRIQGGIGEAIEQVPVDENSSFIVVTRSPDLDASILPLALNTPARYIGVMGSGKRWRATKERVIEAGVDPEALDRVHSPIGIEVNAETLEEIAVSIMSEVIRVNRSNPQQA